MNSSDFSWSDLHRAEKSCIMGSLQLEKDMIERHTWKIVGACAFILAILFLKNPIDTINELAAYNWAGEVTWVTILLATLMCAYLAIEAFNKVVSVLSKSK